MKNSTGMSTYTCECMYDTVSPEAYQPVFKVRVKRWTLQTFVLIEGQA